MTQLLDLELQDRSVQKPPFDAVSASTDDVLKLCNSTLVFGNLEDEHVIDFMRCLATILEWRIIQCLEEDDTEKLDSLQIMLRNISQELKLTWQNRPQLLFADIAMASVAQKLIHMDKGNNAQNVTPGAILALIN